MSDHLCRACAGPLAPSQTVTVRGADVELYGCARCGSFEFPDPDWLDAAYADPIASIDIGLPSRCLAVAQLAEAIIRTERPAPERYLDFGGGYGLLTRLLRDRGLDMRHHDPYARNLFAQGLEGALDEDYGAITAVEVVEHLTDPAALLRELRQRTGLVVIGTQLVPPGMTDLRDWWYLIPDLGQHITFLTRRGLDELAARTGFQVTSDGVGTHVLSARPLSRRARLLVREPRLAAAAARVLRRRAGARSLAAEDLPKAFRAAREAGEPGG